MRELHDDNSPALTPNTSISPMEIAHLLFSSLQVAEQVLPETERKMKVVFIIDEIQTMISAVSTAERADSSPILAPMSTNMVHEVVFGTSASGNTDCLPTKLKQMRKEIK